MRPENMTAKAHRQALRRGYALLDARDHRRKLRAAVKVLIKLMEQQRQIASEHHWTEIRISLTCGGYDAVLKQLKDVLRQTTPRE